MNEPNETSPYLSQHIHDALALGSTAELAIDVHVTPSGVFLSGSVASEEQRAEVAAIAAQESGLPVQNDVVVLHGEPDVEIEVLG